MKKILFSLLSTTLLLASFSASAVTMVENSDPEMILEEAKGIGKATLSTDDAGDPEINGKVNGTKYAILFHGCNSSGNNCDDILFVAAWSSDDVSLRDINEWNKIKKFGKAYLDDDDDPTLEMVVNLDGDGVSQTNLEDWFNWWEQAIEGFEDEVL